MPLSDDSLSDHERMLLSLFLGERSDAGLGMPASMADGFLTSVISGPRLITPGDWLPEIISLEDLPEKTNGVHLGAEDAMLLLMRRYNEIAAALARNDVDMLLAVDDDDHEESSNENLFGEMWCFGYLNGISLDPAAWDPLLHDQEYATTLDDIYFLATPFIAKNTEGEIDPDKAELYDDFRRLTAQQRSDIAKDLPEAVLEIYQFWRRIRMAG